MGRSEIFVWWTTVANGNKTVVCVSMCNVQQQKSFEIDFVDLSV